MNSVDITPVEFGKRLKELRTLQRVTLQDIADLLGISKTGVAKIEKGAYNTLPSREQIMAIEDKLNAAHGTLLGANDFVVDRYTKEEQELLKHEGSVAFVKQALAKFKESLAYQGKA